MAFMYSEGTDFRSENKHLSVNLISFPAYYLGIQFEHFLTPRFDPPKKHRFFVILLSELAKLYFPAGKF